jgi:uncharacterized membrane protein
MNERKIACALGWFSIGLGVAELLAPRRLSKSIGASGDHAALTRVLGLREITSGIGILTHQPRPAGWLWSRVVGDVMDLALLGAAFGGSRAKRSRLAVATAAVAGVTVADILASRQTSERKNGQSNWSESGVVHFKKSIIINRPAEELFRFWRNFENLTRIMDHVKSIHTTGEKTSHWIVTGPAGTEVEWDAEIINETPNELIAWQTKEGSDLHHSGTIRFEQAHGKRGTLVTVQMQYCPPGGTLGSTVAKLFGKAPEQQIGSELRPFKQLMETGEISTTEGQPAGRRTSTSARYDHHVKEMASA